jgi:prolyl-tRNA synthetase
MMEVGLMRHCGNGTFYILPMLQRSIEKMTKILDHFMGEIEGQKSTMPTLTSVDLWKKTGRFETAQAELMVMKDRHDKLQLLSPVRIVLNCRKSSNLEEFFIFRLTKNR